MNNNNLETSTSSSFSLSLSSTGEKAEEAHGDKRNPSDFDRWRGLAKIGGPKDRHTIMEQATLEVIEDGRPDYMGDIEDDAETL
jgi:hypothetical protein